MSGAYRLPWLVVGRGFIVSNLIFESEFSVMIISILSGRQNIF